MNECNGCCAECASHFKNLRPSISGYKVSKHLARDLENYKEIIQKILSCESTCFSELHKFEEKIGTIAIFRAKINRTHIVYAVDRNDSKTVLFLRAFKNFSLYGKFLEDKKDIKKLVNSLSEIPSASLIN
jgi:virulence-associated protein VapD